MNCLHQQNTKYKLVIFDFDGTIADTSEGIIDAHQYTLNKMNRESPSEDELYHLIGGQLLNIYITHFGFSEPQAREAVRIYRDRYEKEGIHKARLYSGFEEMIRALKNSNIIIGVATLKAEIFANSMLEELGISNYFDCVCGMDLKDGLTKAQLIEKCIENTSCDKKQTILIGDTIGDLKGAQEVGVDFIGVTYGFGFKTGEEYSFQTIDKCIALLDYIN